MRASILLVLVVACWRSAPPTPAPVAKVEARSGPPALTLDNLVGKWTTRYPGRSTNNTLTIRADGSFEAIDHGEKIVGTGRIVVVHETRTIELHYERLVDPSGGDREFDHVQKDRVERFRTRSIRINDGTQTITWKR